MITGPIQEGHNRVAGDDNGIMQSFQRRYPHNLGGKSDEGRDEVRRRKTGLMGNVQESARRAREYRLFLRYFAAVTQRVLVQAVAIVARWQLRASRILALCCSLPAVLLRARFSFWFSLIEQRDNKEIAIIVRHLLRISHTIAITLRLFLSFTHKYIYFFKFFT